MEGTDQYNNEQNGFSDFTGWEGALVGRHELDASAKHNVSNFFKKLILMQ